MHPPAMPPNFKKNGSLLQKIHVFEISMLRYGKTHFVKVGTFCCIRSQMIIEANMITGANMIALAFFHLQPDITGAVIK